MFGIGINGLVLNFESQKLSGPRPQWDHWCSDIVSFISLLLTGRIILIRIVLEQKQIHTIIKTDLLKH